MKILYVETDSGYIAQAELEFLSSSDPPASGTITRVGGKGCGQQAPRKINVYQGWNNTEGFAKHRFSKWDPKRGCKEI